MISVWLAVCLVAAVAYCLGRGTRISAMMKKLPQAPGQLPYIGVGLTLARANYQDLLKIGYKWTEKEGLIAAQLMGIRFVALNEPEYVEALFSSKLHITKSIQYNLIMKWLNTGLLTSTGQKWSIRRKLLTPAFHFKILEDNLSVVKRNASVLVKKLRDIAGGAVDVHKFITTCTLDVICEAAMGISLNTQNNECLDYMKTVQEVCHTVGVKEITYYYNKDWMFALSNLSRRFYKGVKTLHKFTEQIIRERKASFEHGLSDRSEEDSGKKSKAFIDILLETEKNNKGSFSFTDMREEVDTFMFEGHDTTGVCLTFTLYLLGKHKDIQEKVVREVEEVLGEEEEVTTQQLASLVYLEKVIKESLRLYPSVPYLARLLTADLLLPDGKVVPAGCNAVVMPYNVHRNKKHFKDPEVFDPERFSEDEIAQRHPFAYIPFSAGPRNCIGRKFAMMELKVVISSVLRNFRLETVNRDIETFPFMILRPTEPVIVKFFPRH